MCGTADWEWAVDQYAYVASLHVCQGCALRENSKEIAKDVPGGTITLLSGELKKAELARQREQYLARRKGS